MKIIEDKLNKLIDGDILSINIRLSSADRYVHLMQIIMTYRPVIAYTEEELYEMYEQIVAKNGAKFLEVVRDSKPYSIRIRIFHNHTVNLTGGKSLINDIFALKNLRQEQKIELPNKKGNETMRPVLKETKAIKIFDRGIAVPEQIIMQLFINEQEEKRPFVLKIINTELEKIRVILKESELFKLDDVKPEDRYNIRFSASYDALKEFMEDKDAVEVDMELAYNYYTYFNELNKITGKNRRDYTWIKEYLTHKNMTSPTQVILFQSKKVIIFMENGYINHVNVKHGIITQVEIKYNEVTKEFHL